VYISVKSVKVVTVVVLVGVEVWMLRSSQLVLVTGASVTTSRVAVTQAPSLPVIRSAGTADRVGVLR
jgi:hypothetical protein